MDAVEAPMLKRGLRPVDRIVAGFLLLLLAAGSLALWLVIPAGSLWLLSRLFENSLYHLLVGLFAVPTAMLLFAPVLFWLNGLYLRVTGHWAYDADEDRPKQLRGPLEPLLLWSFVIAFVALAYWFFFLAENPALTV